jgi:hypothetical protein
MAPGRGSSNDAPRIAGGALIRRVIVFELWDRAPAAFPASHSISRKMKTMLMEDLDRLAAEGSLRATLKDKSRRRRAALARSAPAAAGGGALRNDLAPVLELVSTPLNGLRLHRRRLRKRDFGHVREVANSIGALGFCAPLPVSKDKLVLDGEIRLEDALLDLGNRGDIVIDPFLGSGSTLIAAESTARICRGVELDPLHVDVVMRRYEVATGNQAVFAVTGESFVALAARRATDAGPLTPEARLQQLEGAPDGISRP